MSADANRRFSFTSTDFFVTYVVRNPNAFALPYTISVAETAYIQPVRFEAPRQVR